MLGELGGDMDDLEEKLAHATKEVQTNDYAETDEPD